METFAAFLIGVVFVIGWTYAAYSAGYSVGFKRYRQIIEIARNSAKDA